MKKYIIKATVGQVHGLYHEKLSISTRTDTMNVYVPHWSILKSQALVFYSQEEAYKVAAFLTDEFTSPKVVQA